MDYNTKKIDIQTLTTSDDVVSCIPDTYQIKKSHNKLIKLCIGILCIGLICVAIIGVLFVVPSKFTPPVSVVVTPGMSIAQIGQELENKHLIHNRYLWRICVKIVSEKNIINQGDYLFEEPEQVCRVAHRMTRGIYGNSRIKVTIPEGSTNAEIIAVIQEKIPNFDVKGFTQDISTLQGFLFPETYFFFKNISSEQVVKELQNTFDLKTKELFTGVDVNKQKKIIIMASILEREANNPEEAKIISGILWKRIEIGMPLQVDATLKYTTGRGSNKLTLDDLQTDGPYNTYTRKGLPPGPIGNPGIAMITAAMKPEKSAFLYYLHDNNGKVYYAKTHDEHVNNKNRYLK